MSNLSFFIWNGDEFGSRFLGHLLNFSEFCRSCAESCTHCRQHLPSAASNILAFEEVPKNLPPFIEEPEEFLPKNPPQVDIIIAIGVHPDLLSAIPKLAGDCDARAVIVPIEDGKWCSLGMQKQLEEELAEMRVEFAFPRTGRSLLEAGVDGAGVIRQMSVVRSAPCGMTHYVAQQMRWCPNIEHEVNDRVSKAHHSYPCTGAMTNDPVLGDTPLHIAGYTIREEVKAAVARNLLPIEELGSTAPSRTRIQLKSITS
jgi:hypothetical protein